MRVVYVSTDPGIPAFGTKGASAHVRAVLTALVRRGEDVRLVVARAGGAPPAELSGIEVRELPEVRGTDTASREIAAQRADGDLGGILDLLHAQRPVDLVYERYALWGRAASAWSRDRAVPHLLEVNAPLVEEQAEHRVLVDRAGAEEVARAALSATTAVLCVSDEVAGWARRYTADAARVHTLANGVDTTRITPGSCARDPAVFTVGFVGSLKPWHGVATLLEAAALLIADDPAYRVLIVGDGPCAAPLHRHAEALGIARRVEFTGALDPALVPGELHRMDVAAAPYPDIAGCYFSPLKVYEYLAAGLPVVASRVGGLPALLEDGRLGVLVDPGDPRALAAAIARLREDPGRRARLGRGGRRAAVDRHDWSGVVARALRLVAPAPPRRGVAAVPNRAGQASPARSRAS